MFTSVSASANIFGRTMTAPVRWLDVRENGTVEVTFATGLSVNFPDLTWITIHGVAGCEACERSAVACEPHLVAVAWGPEAAVIEAALYQAEVAEALAEAADAHAEFCCDAKRAGYPCGW